MTSNDNIDLLPNIHLMLRQQWGMEREAVKDLDVGIYMK